MKKKTRKPIKSYKKRFIAYLLLLLNTLSSCRWQVGECGLDEHSCAFPGRPGHGRYVNDDNRPIALSPEDIRLGQQRANISGIREKGEEKTPEQERIDAIDRNLKLYYHDKLKGLLTVAKENGFVLSELKHIHECVVSNLQELDRLGFSNDLTRQFKSLVGESESILNLDLAFVTQTPTIHEAALAGDLALVQTLVASGTSVQLTTPTNETALHYVAMAESPNIALAEWLLEQHITKDIIDTKGNTALSIAVERGHVALVKLLMGSGASVALNHEHDWTLLHLATYHGHLQLVQYFVEEVELPISMNKKFKTPLDIAIERNHKEIEAYLRDFLLKAFRDNQDAMRDQLARHLAEDQQQAALQQLQEGLHLPPHAITPETLANRWLAGMDNFLQGNTPPVGNDPAAASSSSGNVESDDIYRKADELARDIIEGIRQNEHQLSPTQREEFRQITVESLRPYTIPAVKRIEARMEEMEQIEQLFKTDVTNSDPESDGDQDPLQIDSPPSSVFEDMIEPADEDEDTSEPEEDDDRLAYVIPSRYYFIPNYRFGNVTRIKRNMQELQESLTEDATPTAIKEDIKDLFYDIRKEQDELKTLYRDMKANISKRGGDALFLLQDISQFDAIQLEALRHERAFVLATASQHGRVLENASTAFKNDREVVLAAVKINGVILDFLSETFKNDREVVLEAVKQNGLALKYAGAGLKKDREVVLTAVRQNGRALEHANGEFKNDNEIVLEAIQKDEYAFQHASKILRRNRNFVLEALKINGKALLHVNEEFKSDEAVVMTAVQSNGNALPHVKGTLKNDRKVVMAAVKSN